MRVIEFIITEASSSLVAIIVTSILSVATTVAGGIRIRRSKARLIHQINKDKQLLTAITIRRVKCPRSPGRTSVAEMEAFIGLKPIIKDKMEFKLVLEDDVYEDKNLLVLGSPVANATSRRAFQKLKKLPLELDLVYDPTPSNPRNIRMLNHQPYNAEYFGDGTVKRDYALIVKCQNPFPKNTNKKIIILAGLHAPGTKVAASALSGKISKEIWKKVKSNDFYAIIKVDMNEEGAIISESLQKAELLNE